MSARVGFGVVVSGMVVLAAWLTIGAATADSRVPLAATAGTSSATQLGPAVAGSPAAPPAVTDPTAIDPSATDPSATAPEQSTATTPESAAQGSATAQEQGTPTSPTPVPRGQEISLLVDPAWADTVSRATGIPNRALLGYAGASLALSAADPDCGVGWNTLAALGAVESGHGTHGGSAIASDGGTAPAILGPDLDGTVYDRIDDTDGGRLDGDAGGDRAVGPLQFIPGTWAEWGADGSGDALADPQQIDDAALAAGRYLCHYGTLTDPATWRTAVFAYNHVESYVDLVAATANDYAARAAGTPGTNG
ncbi:lytic transglycosylase domain-containing protein [Herbiconiux liukaitaii]|uniref:lytic transglycosylase domain-containing protein n=1 Tax=Herbiconiux liukaitaii TaxID=3342799 RepID=UPI0035B731E7